MKKIFLPLTVLSLFSLNADNPFENMTYIRKLELYELEHPALVGCLDQGVDLYLVGKDKVFFAFECAPFYQVYMDWKKQNSGKINDEQDSSLDKDKDSDNDAEPILTFCGTEPTKNTKDSDNDVDKE